MSRLYDRIMFSNIKDREHVRGAVVIDASSCIEYGHGPMLDQYRTIQSLPCVVPPFSNTFIEFNNEKDRRQPRTLPWNWGICLNRTDNVPAVARYKLGSGRFSEGEIEASLADCYWYISGALFIELERRKPIGPVALVEYSLNERGQIVSSIKPYIGEGTTYYDNGFIPLDAAHEGMSFQQYRERYSEEIVGPLMSPVWGALLLINAKNVELIDNPPPPKLSRAHEKRHGEPLVTYKTIKVNPMRTAKHYPPDDSVAPPKTPGDSQQPLSIWRGHFKDYRDGKGLFGNPAMRGVYWWDQHVRGSIDNGATIKDYEVQAPSRDETAS